VECFAIREHLTCASPAPSDFREIGWIKGKRMVKVKMVGSRKIPVVSFPITWDRDITMKELTLTYPNDLAQAVELTTEELSAQLLLMAALKIELWQAFLRQGRGVGGSISCGVFRSLRPMSGFSLQLPGRRDRGRASR
jgi:hypothetical protein